MFDFIFQQIARQGRDANKILSWLTSKGIPEFVSLEVLLVFANKIEKGETWGFKSNGLSELDHAIYYECQVRFQQIESVRATKILQEMAGKPLLEKEVYELTDLQLEMSGIIYNLLTVSLKYQAEILECLERRTNPQTLWPYIKKLFTKKIL